MRDRQLMRGVAYAIGFGLMLLALLVWGYTHRGDTTAYYQTCEQGAYFVGKMIYHWKCQ